MKLFEVVVFIYSLQPLEPLAWESFWLREMAAYLSDSSPCYGLELNL